jgi:hypothetical protein
LFHLPEYSNKVISDESSTTPVLGKGNIRAGGGQKFGEMEYHALLGSDMGDYLYSTRNKYLFKHSAALDINLKMAGINVRLDSDDEE